MNPHYNPELAGTTFENELGPSAMRTSARQIGGTHYTDMDVQPWDAMSAWMCDDEFFGFLRGNVIKYLARAGAKNGSSVREDLLKAQHYLERLIEEIS